MGIDNIIFIYFTVQTGNINITGMWSVKYTGVSLENISIRSFKLIALIKSRNVAICNDMNA